MMDEQERIEQIEADTLGGRLLAIEAELHRHEAELVNANIFQTIAIILALRRSRKKLAGLRDTVDHHRDTALREQGIIP